MGKHLVKCAICGETFDTNLVQAVKHGARRYSHATCEPDNKDYVPMSSVEKVDEDLQKLKNYIKDKFKDKANWVLITKQIKTFKEDMNYTYSGMLKSLIYFFEIQHNGIDKTNGGIGIIPFVYQPARDYYYALWVAQQQNEDKVIQVKEKEVIIKAPRKPSLFKKLFSLGEEDE